MHDLCEPFESFSSLLSLLVVSEVGLITEETLLVVSYGYVDFI